MHQFLGYILTTWSKWSYPCVGLDFLLRGVTGMISGSCWGEVEDNYTINNNLINEIINILTNKFSRWSIKYFFLLQIANNCLFNYMTNWKPARTWFILIIGPQKKRICSQLFKDTIPCCYHHHYDSERHSITVSVSYDSERDRNYNCH